MKEEAKKAKTPAFKKSAGWRSKESHTDEIKCYIGILFENFTITLAKYFPVSSDMKIKE